MSNGMQGAGTEIRSETRPWSWISIEALTAVVAPLTLLTALVVSFGYARSKAYFGYYGIGQGVLNLSVEDYLFRSVDVTFGSAVWSIVAVVLLIALDRLVVSLHTWRSVAASRLVWTVRVLGGASMLLGMYIASGGPGLGWLPFPMAALLLAAGSVVLLRWTLRVGIDRQQGASIRHIFPRAPAVATLIAAIIVATFWSATLYAQELGAGAAKVDDLWPNRLPLVTVFSSEFLDLPGSDIRAREVVATSGDHHYRYTGLRLLTYSNDRWFLISGRYDDAYTSAVVILRDLDSLRIEIASIR